MTTTQQVLLVVYAVLWAAITPTLARLRVFAINDLAGRSENRWYRSGPWWRVFLRIALGFVVANILLAAVLAWLWRYLPDASGGWGILAGALAGITPAVFPRLLHALLASESKGPFFYPDEATEHDVWKDVLRRWDKVWFKAHSGAEPRADSRKRNRASMHLWAALVMAVFSTGLGWLVAYGASSNGEGARVRFQTLDCTLEVVDTGGITHDDQASVVLLQGGGAVLSVPPYEASVFVGETLGQDSVTVRFLVTGPDDFQVQTADSSGLPIASGTRLGTGGGGPGTGDVLDWWCQSP